MPKMISDLPSAVSISDADVVAVEQRGVTKKVTFGQIRESIGFEPGSSVADDMLVFNGSGFVSKRDSRWRTIPKAAYISSAVANLGAINFIGGAPVSGVKLKATDYFSVGDPVRVEIGSVARYGICVAVVDSQVAIAGSPLPLFTAISSISVGSRDMVKCVSMEFSGTGYNTSTTLPLTKGCQHRWRGATGHLVAASFAHMNTSSTVQILIQLSSGTNAFDGSVSMLAGTSTTYGLFKDMYWFAEDTTKTRVRNKDTITVTTPVITGSADWPIFHLYFVVP